MKEFLFTCCILVFTCFRTDLTVEVTSENYLEHFRYLSNFLYSMSADIDKIAANAFNSVRNCRRILIVKCRQLSTLPETLFHERRAFRNVERLEIQFTGIKQLPEQLLRELTELRYFLLQDSQVKSLPSNLFQSNTKLQNLHILRNKLLMIIPTGLLRNNKELNTISIKYNILLESLPTTLFPKYFKHYVRIDLRRNSLKYIEHETFSNLDFLKTSDLDIRNNYLVCLPDYFLNVTKFSEYIRKGIHLTENCFDESTRLCSLYSCNHRPNVECEEAQTSTNIRRCKKEDAKNDLKNGTVIQENSIDAVKNGTIIPENANDKVRNGTIVPENGNDEVRNGTIIPENANDEVKNGTIVPENGKNEVENGTIIPEKSKDEIEKGTIIPKNANDEVRNGTIIPKNANDEVRNKTIIPENANDEVKNGTIVPENGKNEVKNGTIIPEKSKDEIENGTNVPKNANDDVRNGTIIPEKSRDAVKNEKNVDLIVFCVLIVCLLVTLLGTSFFFLHKRRYWIISRIERKFGQQSSCDYYDCGFIE